MKPFIASLIISFFFSLPVSGQDYETGYNFGNGFTSVYRNQPEKNYPGKTEKIYGIINSAKKIVVPIQYKSVSSSGEKGVFEVKDFSDKAGLFNANTEKIIIEPTYNDITNFSDGLAVVKNNLGMGNYAWGAIDIKGNLIIPLDYTYLGPLKEGLMNFRKDGKTGFIDKNNKIIIPAMYDNFSNFSNGLAAIKNIEDGRFGYIDKSNKFVIAPKYEAAEEFYQGYAEVAIKKAYSVGRAGQGSRTVPGEYKLINTDGKELFEQTFNNISRRFEAGFFVVDVDKKKGVIDSSGKFILPAEYTDVDIYKEGNICFKMGFGKSGLMNSKGIEILKPEYDFISSVVDGRFYSKQKGQFAVWNSSGKQLIPADSAAGVIVGKKKVVLYYKDKVKIFDGNGKLLKTFAETRFETFGHKLSENEDSITLNVDQTAYLVNLGNGSKKTLPVKEIGDFNDEGICIGKDADYDFYDYTGKKLNPQGFYSVVNFSEGVCALQKNSTGIPYLADKNFKKIKDLTVAFGGPFSEGLGFASMSNYGKLYYLDKNGNEVFSVYAKEGGACTEGFILIKNSSGRLYHVNKNGKTISTKTWDEAGNFAEGLALVTDKGKCGFIDTAGTIVIELKYDAASSFSKGAAIVKSGNNYFLINKKGVAINNDKYEAAGNPDNGTFPVQKNGKVGLVDVNGNTIIDFKYKNILGFAEDRTWAVKDNKWALLDNKGKELTGFIYDAAYDFQNGYAQVVLNNKAGMVNKTGKLVLPTLYKSVGHAYKNTVVCLKPAEEITVGIK